MNIKHLSITLILFTLLLLAGCIGAKTYEPGAALQLTATEIEIENGTNSSIIDVTVEKLDDEGVPTVFTIKFEDYSPVYVQVIDAETKEPINSITTEPLTEGGRKDIKQFYIYGEKVPYQPESHWQINVKLVYNDTELEKETQTINVLVK